jgi:type IV pilus assembly protein PilA
MDSRKRQQGFSLLELLIVVAIILVIAAIAIPSLLSSRMAANESAAVGALRTLNMGELTYAATCPEVGFSSSILELNTGAICAGGQGIIDDALATGTKSGYTFTYIGTADSSGLTSTYTLTTVPVSPGFSGHRGFYTDQTGVLLYDPSGAAPNNTSPALQ